MWSNIRFSSCNRYKVEGEVNADPETVFQYIDPNPSSPRSKWDKAIKELQCVTSIAEVSHCNCLTITIIIIIIIIRHPLLLSLLLYNSNNINTEITF